MLLRDALEAGVTVRHGKVFETLRQQAEHKDEITTARGPLRIGNNGIRKAQPARAAEVLTRRYH